MLNNNKESFKVNRNRNLLKSLEKVDNTSILLKKDIKMAEMEERMKDLMASISSMNFDDDDVSKFIKSKQEEFQYIGFNYELIYKKFLNCTPVIDHTKDLLCFIIIMMERGTVLANIKKRISAVGKTSLEELISHYGIVSKAKDNDSLTIPRINLLAPNIVCKYTKKCSNINHRADFVKETCLEYFDVMCCNGFSAMIPDDNEKLTTTLIKCYMIWFIPFTQMINSSKSGKSRRRLTPKALFKNNIQFILSSVNNSKFPNESRYKFLVHEDIVKSVVDPKNGKPTGLVVSSEKVNAIEVCFNNKYNIPFSYRKGMTYSNFNDDSDDE